MVKISSLVAHGMGRTEMELLQIPAPREVSLYSCVAVLWNPSFTGVAFFFEMTQSLCSEKASLLVFLISSYRQLCNFTAA